MVTLHTHNCKLMYTFTYVVLGGGGEDGRPEYLHVLLLQPPHFLFGGKVFINFVVFKIFSPDKR